MGYDRIILNRRRRQTERFVSVAVSSVFGFLARFSDSEKEQAASGSVPFTGADTFRSTELPLCLQERRGQNRIPFGLQFVNLVPASASV